MKNKSLFIGGLFLTLFLLCSCSFFFIFLSRNDTNYSNNTRPTNSSPTATPFPTMIVNKTTPDYIIEKTDVVRYDDGISHYVLIPEIDKTSDKFKVEIQRILEVIRKEHGDKISIEIFDNTEALELSYSREVNLKMIPSNKKGLVAMHYIASFNGELSTGLYKNTLYYFPAAFRDNDVVGRWVETIEYK